jgi:dihydroorotate dehydrogenase (NAD+) catalytic subunit
MVYQVAKNVSVPIIGMGGIMTGEDAIEFIMAGATAVAVGSANFIDPFATIKVLEGIEAFAKNNDISDLSDIRGVV